MVQKIETPDKQRIELPDPAEAAQQQVEGWFTAGLDLLLNNALTNWIFGLIGMAITLVVDIMQAVLAKFALLFVRGQGLDSTEFFPLVAAILHDLTGVEVNADQIRSAAASRGRLAGMQAVGADFFQLLRTEFGGDKQVTPESGIAAAETFIGFLLSFAVRQGNIALLSEISTLHYAEQFREYGEMMAKNLGLSRLARQALKPLITTMIAEPMQQFLNRKNRPKILNEKQAVTAMFKGVLSAAETRERLALLGYPDPIIEEIIRQNARLLSEGEIAKLAHLGFLSTDEAQRELMKLGLSERDAAFFIATTRPQISESELITLWLGGQVAEESVVTRIKNLGFTEEAARQKLAATLAQRATNERDALITEATDQAKRRDLAIPEYEALLRSTSLSKGEIDLRLRQVRQHLSAPRKHVGLAEMEKLFRESIIDLIDWRGWLEREGYPPEEQRWLTQSLLLAALKEREPKAPKRLSVSELRKALTSGLITVETFRSDLGKLGFTSDSIDILLAETIPPAPPQSQ